MLKEALDWLGKIVTDSKAATLVDLKDPRKVFVSQGGTLTPHDVPAGIRGHTVHALDDLIAAAEKWNTAPVAWLNSDFVRLVIDDNDRRDTVNLPLVKSSQFKTLERLASTPRLDQAQLLRILRTELPGAEMRVETINVVRKVRFKKSSEGVSEIQHGNESLGRQIEAEITGSGVIPEQIVVRGPVFSNHGERELSFAVTLDLEIVPGEEKFVLKPLPDELERAQQEAIESIRDRLNEGLPDGVAVFFGSP